MEKEAPRLMVTPSSKTALADGEEMVGTGAGCGVGGGGSTTGAGGCTTKPTASLVAVAPSLVIAVTVDALLLGVERLVTPWNRRTARA